MIRNSLLPALLSALMLTTSPTLLAAKPAGQDPLLQADPATLEFILTVPRGIGLVAGKTVLAVSATDSVSGTVLNEVFVLDLIEAQNGAHPVYRIARQDVARLRALQDEAARWSAAKGSVSLSAAACTRSGASARDDKISVSLRPSAGDTPVTLVRDLPADRLGGAIGPCPAKS